MKGRRRMLKKLINQSQKFWNEKASKIIAKINSLNPNQDAGLNFSGQE